MNGSVETVQLTEEQIDLIARRTAKIVLDGEKERILKILDVFSPTRVGDVARKIRTLLK